MKLELSVEESIEFAREDAYWEGMAEGFRAATDIARQRILERVARSKIPTTDQSRPAVNT
jgi:hypothetical protein